MRREAFWILEKDFSFEASHQLPRHNGKCARLHGHSWKMTVKVAGQIKQEGSETGMVMDYGIIKENVQPLIDSKLDHHHLNETTGLPDPTSEALARWIFHRLKSYLPGLMAVVVQETCTARCTYYEEEVPV